MENQNITTAAVVGLGLIGGSIAKALKEKLYIQTVIGIDQNRQTIKDAIASDTIDVGFSYISDELSKAEIVFVATPVDYAFDTIEKIYKIVKSGAIITDVCSVKEKLLTDVADSFENIRFIGGHPMAGSEKSGFSASDSHLFENAYYILTPLPSTHEEDLVILRDIVKGIGSIAAVMDGKEHDLAVGAVSHLPHMAAYALVNSVIPINDENNYLLRLAAGGFKDITRIASSSPEMWKSIAFFNSKSLIMLIDEFQNKLSEVKLMLQEGKEVELEEFFSQSKAFRDSFDKDIRGLVPDSYILTVDIEDEPGAIAKISVFLLAEGINIKNIGISNIREYEGGVLRIAFGSMNDYEKAVQILSNNGFKLANC